MSRHTLHPVLDAENKPAEREQRLCIGDGATFTDVFRQFYRPLVRFARSITGDTASANDVLQDVFLKLWEDREQLTVKVSLKSLLYTMVRNRALNQNRKTQRIATDIQVENLHHRDNAPSEAGRVDADDLQRHIYRWIDDLPPRRAEAFTLSRYHGLKHSEIATIMGISERTVDTHILLALRTLRQRLDLLQNQDPAS